MLEAHLTAADENQRIVARQMEGARGGAKQQHGVVKHITYPAGLRGGLEAGSETAEFVVDEPAVDAKILILDEPTLGLDIIYRKKFYQSLLNDYFDNERTIIITTHQVEEIEHILTDVVFIREGEIVLDANMDELTNSYFEVMVNQENFEQAMAHKPLTMRKVFGKYIMLFNSTSRDVIETLGEVQRPSVSDLFVALMQEEDQA